MQTLLALAAIPALAILAALVFVLLFEPSLPYRVASPSAPIGSDAFLDYLGAIVNARTFSCDGGEVLDSGEATYAAQLAAIRAARRSVHMEVYLFLRGQAGDAFLAALVERARAGVDVRVVVDRIGSFATPAAFFEPLGCAGGRMRWYQPIAWYTLKRFNNRTHRDLLIVDAEVGFIGGVGVADYWLGPEGGGGCPGATRRFAWTARS